MAESRQQRRARERAEAKSTARASVPIYPEALPNAASCNGAEITHADGFVECEAGSRCAAPGGLHTAGYTCSMRALGMGTSTGAGPLLHECDDCRR